MIIITDSISNRATWDGFASRCSCSYRCAYVAPFYANYKISIGYRVVRLDIKIEEKDTIAKIAQCAIMMGWHLRVFSDQIQILPGYEFLWADIMTAVLERLGPGRYQYGSEWMTEQPRETDTAHVKGVKIISTKATYLEVVELFRWPTWEHYWKSISSNARRNYDRFTAVRTDTHIRKLKQSEAYRRAPQIASIKHTIMRFKGYKSSLICSIFKSLLRNILFFRDMTTTACLLEDRVVAFSACIDFGPSTFYLEGGSDRNIQGAGWQVLLDSIRRTYERTDGKGIFVMGPVDDATLMKPEWQGLSRSRQQCRVSRKRVTVFRFTYDGDRESAA